MDGLSKAKAPSNWCVIHIFVYKSPGSLSGTALNPVE